MPQRRLPPPPAPVPEKDRTGVIPCGAGQTSCVVGASGDVYPCAAIPITLGNVRTEEFKAIWAGSEELRRIRAIRLSDLTACRSCELFTRCNRCAGAALAESGSLLGPSSSACAVARAFEKLCEERRCELH
jgi:radical SAM protein with 4Fe4S-binding SPASM domain